MPSSQLASESAETILNVVLKVAQMHGASVSVEDITQLLPGDATAEDLRSAIEKTPHLSGRFALKDGFIVERTGAGESNRVGAGGMDTHNANLRTARWLSSKFGASEVLTIAVSGSNSYKAASRREDVDLFCVTREGAMWVFLAKALIFARISKMLRRSSAPICLSCVMDSAYAESLFGEDRGALFARDALVAEVVSEPGGYRSLLGRSTWMTRYFPKIYSLRNTGPNATVALPPRASMFLALANRILFVVLGSYIQTKARFHNFMLARQGKGLAIFEARMGPDHLIYESTKYLALRDIYDDIHPVPSEWHHPAKAVVPEAS